MSHGDANRVGLVARDRLAPATGQATSELSDDQWTDALYSGQKAAMRPVHERLMQAVCALGQDVELARKKGYLSLRRKKQLAMIQPGTKWVEIGLIVRDPKPSARLESATRADAMFSYRVRIATEMDVDAAVIDWISAAYHQAG